MLIETQNPSSRIKPRYNTWVVIPEQLTRLVWDAMDGRAPLEEMVHKVLYHGDFSDIKTIFSLYPEVTFYVVNTYPDIHRGVRYWIRKWREQKGGQ